MTWAQFLKLIIENKLLAQVAAIFTAPTLAEKAAAVKVLFGTVVDIFVGMQGKPAVLSADDEAAVENEFRAALAKELGQGDVQAAGFLDRLKQLRDLYERVKPILDWLRVIGVPVPPLPG